MATVRGLALLVAASGLYGFSIGSVHSLRFGLHNIVKFPLLIPTTLALCGLAYFVFACLVGTGLRFGEVQRIVLGLFRDCTVLLAALSPASYFLARIVVKPDQASLGEYPLFLGLNVCFIAVCGCVSLSRQLHLLARSHSSWPPTRRLLVMAGWLGLSLLVGGQVAWYLRPFFGVASIPGEKTRFFLGAAPDYRGSTNFYEAVYHLVAPPPLAHDYTLRGRGAE
jgi:hypothetical protein